MAKKLDTREKILEALKKHGELTTMEIADLVGLNGALAKYYMKTLTFEGKVAWRRLGKRVLMWRLKDKSKEESIDR